MYSELKIENIGCALFLQVDEINHDAQKTTKNFVKFSVSVLGLFSVVFLLMQNVFLALSYTL